MSLLWIPRIRGQVDTWDLETPTILLWTPQIPERGYMGAGDSNEFVLDTTDGNGTDSNATRDQLVTVSGTVFYDGVVPRVPHMSGHWKPMEALPPNKSCPQGKGITPLPLPKAKLMTLRPLLMVPETDIRITARCGNIFWTGTKPWAVSTLLPKWMATYPGLIFI